MTVLFEQTLHGYSDGHRLIASSANLPTSAQRAMLGLSDLAGTFNNAGSHSYLTAYPLNEAASYVLARTWPAPENPRPGCVWTHSLLIPFAELPGLGDPTVLLDCFSRPTSMEDFRSYTTRASSSTAPRELIDNELAVALIDGLYRYPERTVFAVGSSSTLIERTLLSIWGQQWPRLRRSFSFCTDVIAPRRLADGLFDLQIASPTSRAAWRKAGDRAYEVQSGRIQAFDEWVAFLGEDLRSLESPMRTFLAKYGHEATMPRSAVAPLVRIFLETQRDDLVGSDTRRFDVISEAFPHNTEMLSLKKALLAERSSDVNRECSRLQTVAGLKNAAFTVDVQEIDRRAEDIARAGGNIAGLIESVMSFDVSPQRDAVVAGLTKAVALHGTDQWGRFDDGLVLEIIRQNPNLLTVSSVWPNREREQRILLRAAESIAGDAGIVPSVVLAIYESGSEAIAADVARRWPRETVQVVLDSGPKGEWARILKHYEREAIDWLRTAEEPSAVSLRAVAQLISVRDSRIVGVPASRWSSLESVARSGDLDAAAFLLALGFSRPSPESSFVRTFFQAVHDALNDRGSASLGWGWTKLEPFLPHLGHMNWDKCERLRQRVANYALEANWDLSLLRDAIPDDITLERVAHFMQESHSTRRYIQNMASTYRPMPKSFMEWLVGWLLNGR